MLPQAAQRRTPYLLLACSLAVLGHPCHAQRASWQPVAPQLYPWDSDARVASVPLPDSQFAHASAMLGNDVIIAGKEMKNASAGQVAFAAWRVRPGPTGASLVWQQTWVVQRSPPAPHMLDGVAVVNESVVVVAGSAYMHRNSTGGAGGGNGATAVAHWDMVVTSLNATSGDALWQLQCGSTSDDLAHAAASDGRGTAVAVAGRTLGTLPNCTSQGRADFALVALDAQLGHVLWQRQWGSLHDDSLNAAAWWEQHGGTVFVAGQTGGWVGDSLDSTAGSLGSWDAYLARVDGVTGTVVWQRQWGTPAADILFAIAVAGTAGDVLVAGETGGQVTTNATASSHRWGDLDALEARFDAGTGALVWTRQWGSPRRDTARGLWVDAARGQAVVAGHSAGSTPHALESTSHWDMLASSLSVTTGELLHQRQIGAERSQFAFSVAGAGTDGRALVVGHALAEDGTAWGLRLWSLPHSLRGKGEDRAGKPARLLTRAHRLHMGELGNLAVWRQQRCNMALPCANHQRYRWGGCLPWQPR